MCERVTLLWQVLGGCDAGNGCIYAFASFTVDGSGGISSVSLYDHGSGYARDPRDDFGAWIHSVQKKSGEREGGGGREEGR